MNRSEMRAEVAKLLGNMPSIDPFYAEINGWINRSMRRIQRFAVGPNSGGLSLFPELYDRKWQTTTVANIFTITRPSACLAIRKIYSLDSSAVDDENISRGREIRKGTIDEIETLEKATATGWPQKWAPRGIEIVVWPTPTTTYVTKVNLYGILKEPKLSADDQVPHMDDAFHDTIVTYAAGMGAERLGWLQEASQWKQAALADLAAAKDATTLEEITEPNEISFEEWPAELYD